MTTPTPGLLDEAAETTTHTEPTYVLRDNTGLRWFQSDLTGVWYCEDGHWARGMRGIVAMRGPVKTIRP